MANSSSPSSLEAFSTPTREWFTASFTEPTGAQTEAWKAIASGKHALIIAPTGSGKTLAAFLHSIDRLATTPRSGKVRVLYISPLKALADDVARNLHTPLQAIGDYATTHGFPPLDVRVAVRTGDTPAHVRRKMIAQPPDILITTPESLFLMLSGQAASTLTQIETVIVDEIHAIAGTKRGTHLALSLERLDTMNHAGEMQRIGLSATVQPPQQVAAFLAGNRPIEIISPPSTKQWSFEVVVPVNDMTQLSLPTDNGSPSPPSIWPHIETRVLDLITSHRSTICFVNSRMIGERLATHLNEQWSSRPEVPDDAVLVQVHHGSVSKTRRTEIENDLKAGRLPCVVATSSLELGIDMGAVDLVIQIGAPPSVANGLQRVGRAGHQVGACSRGVFFPLSRGDLLETAVAVEKMNRGEIESVPDVCNSLDVLAQHLVSACIDNPQSIDRLFDLVKNAYPYRSLPRHIFDNVINMLTGGYPSDDFAELRPRLSWDRSNDLLTARPGAKQLVTTSGGTIPDRGLFGVFLLGEGSASGKYSPGRRVGELDEEMVFESRVADVFTLGTSSWRIEEITPSQVLVTPAPGVPSRLPFWRGDTVTRPVELGKAMGVFIEECTRLTPHQLTERLSSIGLDDNAVRNLSRYLIEQREATEQIPCASKIVIERFRDELGDWRLCVHSSLGRAILTPWSLAIGHRAKTLGYEATCMIDNDGIIIRILDTETPPSGATLVTFTSEEITDIITQEIFSSALFAARFRECAARALLLPRRDPGKRSPLWLQRIKSTQLLGTVADYPDFPIVLETMRECLQEAFDLPGLITLLQNISNRSVQIVEIATEHPSPFAAKVQFSYIAEYLYDDDQPLAERRLAAASIDPDVLASLLNKTPEQAFDAELLARVGTELTHTAPSHRATSAEQLWDLLRLLGPLTSNEIAERVNGDASSWLDNLLSTHRVITVQLPHDVGYAVTEDRDFLAAALADRPEPAALARLIARIARRSSTIEVHSFIERFGTPETAIRQSLSDLIAAHKLTPISYVEGEHYVHVDVLRMAKRRKLSELRSQVEAVKQQQFARFLPVWQEVTEPSEGFNALYAALDQLAGYPIPASMLENFILPARVKDYTPAMLDELMASGDIVWTGQASIATTDGWIQLWPGDYVLRTPDDTRPSELAAALWETMREGGAWRLNDLVDQTFDNLNEAIWELVWLGWVTSESFAPLRISISRGTAKGRPPTRPSRYTLPRARLRDPLQHIRWTRVTPRLQSSVEHLIAAVNIELSRYGILTRGSVLTEAMTPSYPDVYRVLSGMEETGRARRGYFIDGLGAAQFALPGAVDRLREKHPGNALLLAAVDPANPYGAALPWPTADGPRPSRKVGALVVLDEGVPTAYLERGARTLLSFPSTTQRQLHVALSLIGEAVDTGRLPDLTVERINETRALERRDLREIFTQTGFVMVPQGYRRRARRVTP